MAGIARNVMRLLLFSFICAKGDNDLMSPERDYDVMFPCEGDSACIHLWHLRRSEYIAIVINRETPTAKPEDEDSRCALQSGDPTEVDDRHSCQKRPDVFSPNNAVPHFNLMPGKSMSMQCIRLAYVQRRRCSVQQRHVILTWVNEAGAEVPRDSQHRIKRGSLCNTTLTVTFQSAGNRKFGCRATVNGQFQTSEELWVRVPDLKGKGRVLIINPQPEIPNQDGTRSTIGIAVGVVGLCAALTALVAAFVARRRLSEFPLKILHLWTGSVEIGVGEDCHKRGHTQGTDQPSNQPPDKSHTNNNVTSADDVVYADVILPRGSRQVWVHESTEYACVKHK